MFYMSVQSAKHTANPNKIFHSHSLLIYTTCEKRTDKTKKRPASLQAIIYPPNGSKERQIPACMVAVVASMERKRYPTLQLDPTPTHQQSPLTHGIGTSDLTQQHKQAHDQDLDSRPAFEFALLKEHEQNAAREQPASTE